MSFLIMIFVGYILYGLISSLLPSVWVNVANSINVDYTLLGLLMMICTGASGVSSALAYKFRRKFGTSISIVISMTCWLISLFLFFFAKNLPMICLALLFLGAANGLIDTVSNSYMIKAYGGGKISLLHASWGLGSSIGPILMSYAVVSTSSYQNGFLWSTYAVIISILIIIALKIWWEGKKKTLPKEYVSRHSVSKEEKDSHTNMLDIFKINLGIEFVICYVLCGSVNSLLNSWMATLSTQQRAISVADGAKAASFFFIGLTIIRLILGLISSKIKTKYIMYPSMIVLIIGTAMLFVRNNSATYAYIAASIIGAGVAPLIPFLNHSIKEIFDEEYIGVIMSCCNSISLICGAIITALMSLVIKLIGINNCQIMPLVLILIAFFAYIHIIKKREQN